jgi:outer membrane lipoprotein-sorting protein
MICLAGLLVGLLILAAGCPKSPEQAGPTPGAPGKTPAAAAPKPAAPAAEAPGDLAKIMDARKGLTSYVMTTTVEGKTIRQVMKLKDGQPVRIKSDTGQPGSWVLMQMDQKVTYMYDAKKKVAIKMAMPEGTGNPEDAAKALRKMPGAPKAPDLADLKARAPKITSANLDGVDCWLIEVGGEKGAPSQTWVDKQYGLVRQYKMGDKTIKMTYDQINAVPDSEFELPPGTKIMGLPGGMPAMPKP